MTWNCAAIDHGVTIFPNGKIAPCCQTQPDYLKPISELSNPNRFSDLKTQDAPAACQICNQNEHNNLPSLRGMFNDRVTDCPGLQFVDIRNTNLCNLKCRYCGPHFSSQWASEMGGTIVHQKIDHYKDLLITDSLQWMYFTGGEPLIGADHWQLLQELISADRAQGISLLYSTNLTTIKFKDLNIVDLWSKFKSVKIQCSIDAVGQPLEYIRSGANWNNIESNLTELSKSQSNQIEISLSPVISILSLWFVDDLFEYAVQNKFRVDPIVLTGPDYLALDVVPDQLKDLALSKILKIKPYISQELLRHLQNLINNNINQCLFKQTLAHVLLLDKTRNEKLFELLPFQDLATDLILRNYEYQ